MIKAIVGNTFPVKEGLKLMGAKWNAKDKCWMIEEDKFAKAQAMVNSHNNAYGNNGNKTSTLTGAIKKRCWECGRMFTRSQCADKHDWNDSYCGC